MKGVFDLSIKKFVILLRYLQREEWWNLEIHFLLMSAVKKAYLKNVIAEVNCLIQNEYFQNISNKDEYFQNIRIKTNIFKTLTRPSSAGLNLVCQCT